MRNFITRKSLIPGVIALIVAIVIVVVVMTVGGSGPKLAARNPKPLSVVAGPAGLIGGTTPDTAGRSWVLVNLRGKANLQYIDMANGAVDGAVPLSNESRSVATATGGVVGVGLSGNSTGAVEFFSSQGFHGIGSVALPGPVLDLVAGSNGESFYALVDANGDDSVSIVSDRTFRILGTIPLPSATLSIAVSPDLSSIYSLQANGRISIADIQTGQVIESLPSAAGGRQLALSVDGSTLYVLKGSVSDDNVSVINVATQSTVAVLPAPAYCRWIAPSLDGTQLVDFVGTSTYGNLQNFATHR
jgi:DNA-binding beta-propeller fold protein YncE